MTLTFKSSTQETFTLTGIDTDGSTRSVTAVSRGSRNWDLTLRHPSGMSWKGSFSGAGILDAMSEMLASREPDYLASKGRGHQAPQARYGSEGHRVNDGVAAIIPQRRF